MFYNIFINWALGPPEIQITLFHYLLQIFHQQKNLFHLLDISPLYYNFFFFLDLMVSSFE